MLNTSLHNPNVRDKPAVERFISMNRGINEGGDLPEDLLRVILTIKKWINVYFYKNMADGLSRSDSYSSTGIVSRLQTHIWTRWTSLKSLYGETSWNVFLKNLHYFSTDEKKNILDDVGVKFIIRKF